MEGAPHDMRPSRATWKACEWVSGCVLTGAERSGSNELVRSLHDAVKHKLYYAYDRYNDMYLRIPT